MSTRNKTLGHIGLAVAALVTLAVTGCDPYQAANTAAPVVVGVAVVDTEGNGYNPWGYNAPQFGTDFADGCYVPYPEPDITWAQATFPGLCDPAYLIDPLNPRPSACPVACWPPRSGPGFAPFYLGNLGSSYVTAGGGSFVYQTSPVYVVQHVPPGVAPAPAWDPTQAFTFAKITIVFNKLMAGASIQPDVLSCVPPAPVAGSTLPNITAVSPANSTATPTDVTTQFRICYSPNSSATYWGGSITLTPAAVDPVEGVPVLPPNTRYHVTGTVYDQQGNPAILDVTVITDP